MIHGHAKDEISERWYGGNMKLEDRLKDVAEAKACVTEGIGAQMNCLQAGVGPTYDPKEVLLRQIDYAEEQLVRRLSVLKELRNELNWASPEAVRLVSKYTQVNFNQF
jgi:hypothetical protein